MTDGSSSGRPRRLALEPFDPAPSVLAALDLFARARVPFALAGRLAVWTWVAEDEQEFTKDVDFAVRQADLPQLEATLRAEGYAPIPLPIGGLAIRKGATRIDFIDRRVDFGDLFTAAVDAAASEGSFTTTSDGREVPVVPARFVVAMKLATGDPRDERDVERVLAAGVDYAEVRSTVRRFLGPAAAYRLDHIGARVGREEAARYVRDSEPRP
jgi:hypothetical protein